jgi:ribosomal protein S18 acetylase RimI-like enzyme
MPLPVGVVSHPALAYTTAQLAEIMTACFQGYVVPTSVTAEQFDGRFRRENLDLKASRVFWQGDRPVALILVARRGWTSRIAAMGIVPELRGRGLGRHALSEVLGDLRQGGNRRIMLEVIESNEPAVRLYRGLGFEICRRLIGYRRPARPEDAAAAAPLTEIDPQTVARTVALEGAPDLPWIMAPETLAAAAAPARGLTLGDALAIVEATPQPSSLALRTLVVPHHARGRGLGRRMVSSLAAAHPGQDLVVSANFPEDLVPDFMAHTGFERTPISQFEMVMTVAD